MANLTLKGIPAALLEQARRIRKMITDRYHVCFGEIIEIKVSDEGGIRFDSNENFIGFLEP